MVSNLLTRECPKCGQAVMEGEQSKSVTTPTPCNHCKYYYSEKVVKQSIFPMEYKKLNFKRCGINSIVKKDGDKKIMMIQSTLILTEIDNDINQENNFLVTYRERFLAIGCGPSAKSFIKRK